MAKTIDEVTQDELEQLYLENDWNVKKVAKILGCSMKRVGMKFSSFYDTQEKRQELVYKFKIINSRNLSKLSHSIYIKQLNFSTNYYQIPLDELIESYKINNSFEEIAKKYRTTKRTIVEIFNSQINTEDDYNLILKEFNIKTAREFQRKFPELYIKLRKSKIKLLFSKKDFSEFIGDIERIKRHIVNDLKCSSPGKLQKKDYSFYYNVWYGLSDEDKSFIFPNCRIQNNVIKFVSKFNSPFEAVKYYVVKNNIKTIEGLRKSWFTLYKKYFLPLTPEEKEMIFPEYTKGNGWEKEMKENLQKAFLTCTIVAQKTFDNCKNINQLPFDFALYSPTGKLIALIEVHGPTHFREVYKSERSRFKDIRKRDIIKYEYCKKNNIPLLYFTYEPSLTEKYGYPYPVHTVFEELVQKLQELIQKVS